MSCRRASIWREKDLEVLLYDGTTRRVQVLSDCGLWSATGGSPVAMRWVLAVDPTDLHPLMAVFSTDLDLPVDHIIAQFVLRWNMEVTVEASQRHVGVETQRQ